jgi:hypothetical protein
MGFDRPERRMISAVPQRSAVARIMLARHTCSAARCDPSDRLKPMAVCSCNEHDNSCSHDKSLNCFGRFGNRLNESNH